jgi:hypothetical protein
LREAVLGGDTLPEQFLESQQLTFASSGKLVLQKPANLTRLNLFGNKTIAGRPR